VNARIHVFFTSTLFGGEMLASCSGRFTAGENAFIRCWVGPRTGLDDVERRNSDPSVIQPVVNPYTECAIPAREINRKFENF
jgi:hypothetical protein